MPDDPWDELMRHVRAHRRTDYPPSNWLSSRMSSEEEQEVLKIPFFAELARNWQEGDELWKFSSPQEQWMAFAGRGGIALVRGGRSIAYVVTELN
jgi:hypothetical protein